MIFYISSSTGKLHDPGDEFVLDLAIAAGCNYLITFNQRHFTGAEQFTIKVVTPGEFLKIIYQSIHYAGSGRKMAAIDTKEYLQKRAARDSRQKLLHVLAKSPDVEPDEADRIVD